MQTRRKTQIIKFSALLKESWQLTKANWVQLLLIVGFFQLFPRLLTDLSQLLAPPWNTISGFLMMVPLIIAPVYGQICIYFLVDQRKARLS